MATHESSVNYQNLIKGLAEMYTFEVAEVVVVELVANALDAGAITIALDYDSASKILAVTDNGKGMDAAQFDEYHDFAAGLKTRGTGIGFAGVGAKISFNIADRVTTETRSEGFAGGSNWYLQSKKKLVWEDIEPVHLSDKGTRVQVTFKPEASITYSRTEHLIQLLRRHYLPLLDTRFLDLYQLMGCYSSQLRFVVNGQVISPTTVDASLALDRVRKFYPTRVGKRIGFGVLGLAATEYPVAPDVCGVLLCTHGKVIKPDLFNQFPGALGPRLFGLVEIPDFVKFLTTAKTDFIRGPGKHREFEHLYDPVRQEFKAWLTELGVEPTEISRTDDAAKLERELRKLVDDIPELADFFGFRSRKAVLQQSEGGVVEAVLHEGVEITLPVGEGSAGQGPGPLDEGDAPGTALVGTQGGAVQASPISRVGRRGPKIGFADRSDRTDLAWVDGNKVVVNSGHPSYHRARSNTLARTFHNLFAIGSAIQRFKSSEGGQQDLMFIDRMMAAWGKR